MNIIEVVRESNRIEGIMREPTDIEISTHEDFLGLKKVEMHNLENFVSVYQPNAVMRTRVGWNVRVGNHTPPKGGPHIAEQLQALLDDANKVQGSNEAWSIHIQYEILHPFTDGNGRSGRMLWYWMMGMNSGLGFLHTFYYQTLNNYQRE